MDDWKNWIPSEVKKSEISEEEKERRHKIAENFFQKLREESQNNKKQ